MADLVAVVDRRGALKRAGAALLTISQWRNVMGQTLISESADSGRGLSRSAELVPAVEPAHQAQSARAQAYEGPSTGDWRFDLLRGERSILMARGGRAERVRYCTADGQLDREGYARACYLLRDVKANRLYPMDPALLDRICGIQRWGEYYGSDSVFEASSGFRTNKTNLSTEGAALHSKHLEGKAGDGNFVGIPFKQVAAMSAIYNRSGGTGIYVSRAFVHIDTGRSRQWFG